MATKAELACVYSALILADDDVTVTADKISSIIKAANVDVEPFWPGLFAKALTGLNIKDMISNVGAGAAPSAPAGAGGAGETTEKEEEKKEEAKKESEDEDSDSDGSGFGGLFDD